MRLFPQLVFENYCERVVDVLIPNGRIAGGSRVIDQVVQPLPFLRAQIKYRGVRPPLLSQPLR
jgi:hypothetical protein